jgi:hypothetical protein
MRNIIFSIVVLVPKLSCKLPLLPIFTPPLGTAKPHSTLKINAKVGRGYKVK